MISFAQLAAPTLYGMGKLVSLIMSITCVKGSNNIVEVTMYDGVGVISKRARVAEKALTAAFNA
jgi:hypothetical protein